MPPQNKFDIDEKVETEFGNGFITDYIWDYRQHEYIYSVAYDHKPNIWLYEYEIRIQNVPTK